MPVLPLSNDELDPLQVKAAMLYPRDEKARNLYGELYLAEFQLTALKDAETIRIRAGLLRTLFEGDNPAARLVLRERTRRGIVAGNLLRIMYVVHLFGAKNTDLGEPSLHKAIHVCQVWADKYQYGDGSKINISKQAIRDCWDEFSPSAHLWAAQMLNIDFPYVGEQEFFSSAENLRSFLGVAAGVYQFAATYVPRHSPTRAPIIDPQESWSIPKTVAPLKPPDNAAFPDLLAAITRTYKIRGISKPRR